MIREDRGRRSERRTGPGEGGRTRGRRRVPASIAGRVGAAGGRPQDRIDREHTEIGRTGHLIAGGALVSLLAVGLLAGLPAGTGEGVIVLVVGLGIAAAAPVVVRRSLARVVDGPVSTALGRLREDVRTAFERDPAARTTLEVVSSYPGLHAVWAHRIAHRLRGRGLVAPSRFLSHVTRLVTGVEIHPGAEIGRRVFIDHGMGVVVGETAVVGDDVLIYHGCTLGATSSKEGKRHPTVEDGATLGANATVLGDVTVGEGATVGAGSVVVDPVPPGTTVAGNPARPVSGPDAPHAIEDPTGKPPGPDARSPPGSENGRRPAAVCCRG